MTRQFTSTLTCALIGLLAAADVALAQAYTITDVGANRSLSSVNDLGQVVGTETYMKSGKTAQTTRGFVWSNAGGRTDLGVLPRGTFSNARAINASGDVVGYGDVPATGNTWRAFLWRRDTGMLNLNDVAAPEKRTAASQGWILRTAFGINDNGQIVGWGENIAEPERVNAYLWQLDAEGNAVVRWLPLGTRYADAETRGINESGQVVGSVTNETVEMDLPLAAVWQVGTETTTTLGLLPNGRESHAYSINNSGEAVGYGWGANTRAVYWNSGSTGPWDLGTLGGASSTAFEISESGQAVGWAHNSLGYRRAFVWDNGFGMRNLNTLSNVGSTWVLETAKGISPNSGFIVGNGTVKVKSGTQGRAFLLLKR